MTEKEQKAFDQMREALEEIICAHPATSTMRQVHAIVAGRNALTAANAVQQRETNKAVGAALSHAFKNFEAIAKGEMSFAVPADAVAIAENGQVSWLQGKTLFGTHYLYAANAVQPQAQWEALLQKAMKLAVSNGWIPKSLPHDEYLSAWALMSEFLQEVAHPQATEPAWRPIESAPKDGTEIIGCWPSYIDSSSFARVTCKYVGWSWVTTDYRDTELAQPTYWMPLPAAPEAHHGK